MPVIAVGRLGNPATAKAAIESGKADFIALGRALIAVAQCQEWVIHDRDKPATGRATSASPQERRPGSEIG